MTRIYYTTRDCGDGSAVVDFFETQECIIKVEEADPETYGMGEGGSYFDVDGTITGIKIVTEAQVDEAVEREKTEGYLYFD